MQYYFAKEIKDNKAFLYEKDLHHIKNVMRMKKNDEIMVVYNKKKYNSVIVSMSPVIEIEIKKENQLDTELSKEIIIAFGMIKEQKQDFMMQKLAELGVSKMIPLDMERSVVKIDPKKEEKKLERWRLILKEASEQSHRSSVPELTKIMSIKDLETEEADLKLVLSVNKKTKMLKNVLQNIDNYDRIIIVVGPEGGITPKEEKTLSELEFQSVSLGNRILRAETASIYITSIINYCCMR